MILIILSIVAIFWVFIIIGTINDGHKAKKKRKGDEVLEAKFQIEKEEYKPTIEKLTAEQRDLIENADQKVLINHYKKAIDSCKKNAFIRKLNKLKKIKELLKKEQTIVNRLAPYYYSNDEKNVAFTEERLFLNIDVRKQATSVNLYIVKIKNTIDSKLYLIVGLTTETSTKKAFKNDLVVELIDELRFVEINSFDAVHLLNYLVGKYKPEGSIDPFAKFDGCENIIEMRLFNKASSALDNFLKSIGDLDLIENRFIKMTKEQFQKKFEEYGFKEYFFEFLGAKIKSNNPHLHLYINDKQSDHLEHSDPFKLNIESIIKFFYDNIYLNCHKEFIKTEKGIKRDLDEIQNNFQEWQEYQIFRMENFVDTSKELNKNGLTFYNDEHPLSANFNNSKSILPLEFPWHQVSYGYGFDSDGEFIELNDSQHIAFTPSTGYSQIGNASIAITRETLKTEFKALKAAEEKTARAI